MLLLKKLCLKKVVFASRGKEGKDEDGASWLRPANPITLMSVDSIHKDGTLVIKTDRQKKDKRVGGRKFPQGFNKTEKRRKSIIILMQ